MSGALVGFWELSVRCVGAVVSVALLPGALRSPGGGLRKTPSQLPQWERRAAL